MKKPFRILFVIVLTTIIVLAGLAVLLSKNNGSSEAQIVILAADDMEEEGWWQDGSSNPPTHYTNESCEAYSRLLNGSIFADITLYVFDSNSDCQATFAWYYSQAGGTERHIGDECYLKWPSYLYFRKANTLVEIFVHNSLYDNLDFSDVLIRFAELQLQKIESHL